MIPNSALFLLLGNLTKRLLSHSSIIAPTVFTVDAPPSIDPERRQGQRLIYPIAENHNEVLEFINAHYTLILDEDGYQVYQIQETQ